MKQAVTDALYSLCIALWVGGLWAIGYVAVPMLFATIADRSQAGGIAGVMFLLGGWLGFVFAITLLSILAQWHRWQVWRNPVARIVLAMLILGLIGQLVVQPEIAAIKAQAHPLPVAESPLHAQFARWHGVSSVLYLIQALLGLALVVLQSRGRRI